MVQPPFSKLSIDIRKNFFRLIHKYFNGNNPLKDIFNRKTIKISYSCTNNVYKIISNDIKNFVEKSCVD